jgi:cytochrome P450
MADAMKKGIHIDLLWKGISEQLGSKLFCIDVIFFKLVVILDVEMAKEVLVTKNYPKSFTYDSFYPLIGGKKSILVSSGNIWHEQRMAFNPGFHYQYLKNLVPIFASNTQRLVSILEKKCTTQEVVPMHLLLTQLTMDIICQVREFMFMMTSSFSS